MCLLEEARSKKCTLHFELKVMMLSNSLRSSFHTLGLPCGKVLSPAEMSVKLLLRVLLCQRSIVVNHSRRALEDLLDILISG